MSGKSSHDDPRRPKALRITSFSRLESPVSSPISPSRSRANTIQIPSIAAVPEARDISQDVRKDGKSNGGDIFETNDDHNPPLDAEIARQAPEIAEPETLEQLPIEIRSLTERFFKSLSARSHTTPLNIDAIAELFQDFYVQAETHIATHIASLATRIHRDKSPAPSISSRTSRKGISRTNTGTDGASPADESGGDQQMLTASEITDRRKARRQLDLQRLALEEAVERGVCETVYDRVYRHRTTDDAERDAKLRSKTAALALVGIGLKDLHVDISSHKKADSDSELDIEKDIHELLGPARESLHRMDDEHYPLGKLQYLTAAHKSIVETLAQLFPSSSSADEVLPTLIYTLITLDPAALNVASNLHFIQLFRSSAKVDGETAYCLVNLEAAISFLETVDLSSLRDDEVPEGPPKPASRSETPTTDRAPVQPALSRSLTPGLSPVSASAEPSVSDVTTETKPRPLIRAGAEVNASRLSSILQAQAEHIEARRENFLSTADQALESINSTLEGSFKFLFGRLKEQSSVSPGSPVIIPRTLEDARRLVSSPPSDDEDSRVVSGGSSVVDQDETTDDPLSKPDNKMLELIGGKRIPRERSTDSTRSNTSGKHVAFATKDGAVNAGTPLHAPTEAVGNLINTLNPLSRFSVPSFGRFGRSVSGPGTPAAVPSTEKTRQMSEASSGRPLRQLTESPVQAEDDLNAAEALAQLKRAKPPMRRFVDLKDGSELRIGEVDKLLKDYQRLAQLLKDAVNAS